MTEYGRERERRCKWRTVVQGLVAVCATARLAVTVGLVTAVLAALAFLVVAFGVGALVVWCRRGARARRRAAGAAPSWSAHLPVVAAQQCGAMSPERHSRRRDSGELFGRLVYFGDQLRWEPRKADRKRGACPISWDRSWSAHVVTLWGLVANGCLTLTRADGTAVDVWVSDPGDLRRTLGLAGTR
jgi:hypothetical protein